MLHIVDERDDEIEFDLDYVLETLEQLKRDNVNIKYLLRQHDNAIKNLENIYK